jgi:hypothetical protein
MAALRRAIGPGGTPDSSTREELRGLARRWPGALRELDSLDTDEIDRRARACAAVAAGDAAAEEPWMAPMARYHGLMRAALALRRGADPAELRGDEGDEDATALPPEFVRAVAAPGHGRLNVAVFAQLAAELGQPARALWDALFPRRGSARRRYRE